MTKTKTPEAPTIIAGPITVRAGDLRRAWQNASQARARNTKMSEASQCVHVEWHGPDLLLLVGVSDKIALRAPVRATVTASDDLWPTDLPEVTSLVRDKDKMLSNLIASAAGRPGDSTITLREQRRRDDDQLEGHDWIHELVVTDNHSNVLAIPVSTSEPTNWRSLEPYDAMELEAGGIGRIQLSADHANRLGTLRGIAHVSIEMLGDQRPVRVVGSHQSLEVLRGWLIPQRLDPADGATAIHAASFMADIGAVVCSADDELDFDPDEDDPCDSAGGDEIELD